jgi:serine/threonine protein kinase
MKLDHPNIAKVFETWQTKEHFFLVMELCEGGELLHYVADQERLGEKETANILR